MRHRQANGACYKHHRQWIEDRIRILPTVFSIDICSYAVMSNHYPISSLKLITSLVKMEFNEVIQRWLCIHKGPFLIKNIKKVTLSVMQK
jgi:hypothetical protein